jgi:hypothetical protein
MDPRDYEEFVQLLQETQKRAAAHEMHFSPKNLAMRGLSEWERTYGMAFIRLISATWMLWVLILVMYLVWFLIRYFTFVIRAIGGAYNHTWSWMFKFALYMIRSLIKPIRMFIPRKYRRYPSPYREYQKWRSKYIDSWVAGQMMIYRARYYLLREKTYERWKGRLITEPARQLDAWYQKFKQVHIDLTYEEFTKLVSSLYPMYTGHTETAAYLQEHGKEASQDRFFTFLSKALHHARSRSPATGADSQNQRIALLPSWLPVVWWGLWWTLVGWTLVAAWWPNRPWIQRRVGAIPVQNGDGA